MSGYYKHDYAPGVTGRCTWQWVDSRGNDRTCGSTQASSVMHYDADADFRELHWHGGGDCMCFENDYGPSYDEAMASFKEAYERS